MSIAIYLKTVAVLFMFLVGIPLLFIPLKWARLMRWHLPEDTHLTAYFGRCLGAVVVAISGMYFRHAENVRLHNFLLELLIYAFSLMVLVHVWGFFRRTQPWTENAEIPVYLGFAIATAILRYG